MNPTTPDLLEQYADWTVQAWLGPEPLEPRDFAIMGLGLAGETGEVLDLLLPDLPTARPGVQALVKEMGDIFYYWARICRAFGIPLKTVWPEGSRRGFTADLNTAEATRALRLAKYASRVAEQVKKHVRDDHCDPAALRQALADCVRAWLAVARGRNLNVEHVLAVNREKIEDRIRRGVQRGSGDER